MNNKIYSEYFTNRGVELPKPDDCRLLKYLELVIGNNKNIKILDIGCGYGNNMFALLNLGFANVVGIDISDEAINYCKMNNLNVQKMNVTEYHGEKFDFIIMSHVLEHLPKDKIIETLKLIKNRMLNVGGQLCVIVPNAQSNVNCYWAYEDFTHNLLFTGGSLLFVLREAGFKNIKFIDIDGLDGTTNFFKKIIKRLFLKLFKVNFMFWNKVTGSYWHAPSPVIFTWEIKCVAKNE